MNHRACVITVHHVKNYGSVLQAYATQQTLQGIGTDPFIVDFWRHDQRNRPSHVWDHHRWGDPLTRAAYWAVRGSVEERRREIFNTLVDQHLDLSERSCFGELTVDSPDADIYCTGSDQRWNADCNGISNGAHFLPFAPPERKQITLSANILSAVNREAVDFTTVNAALDLERKKCQCLPARRNLRRG